MPTQWGQTIWSQFGASIDALKQAVEMCPDDLWEREEYWHLAFHTLFWLDFYLSETPDGFLPPAPFTLDEMDPERVMPERSYTRNEMFMYLTHCREKCRNVVSGITDDHAASPSGFERLNPTIGELHLYNLRHVQHGAAQLNLQLRWDIDKAPGWVFRANN